MKTMLKSLVNASYSLSRAVNRLQRLSGSGQKTLAKLQHARIFSKYNCEIAASSRIAPDVEFPHPCGVVIGEGVIIGSRCKIYQQVTIGQKDGLYPVIGDDVTIYPGARVIGGIRVERGAVIGANAVVLHDVPAYAIVAGVPATVKSYKMLQGGTSLSDAFPTFGLCLAAAA